MTPGEFVVILVLACVVGLAIRSVWKSGGSCNGDCSQCSSCHHK